MSVGAVPLVADPPTTRTPDATRAGDTRRRTLTGWLATLAVTIVAAVVRVLHLGRPPELVFDEVYYAREAWSLLRFGVETAPAGGPAFVVHPPAGKWAIALGEAAFGLTPWGWRVAAAVAGTLTVAVVVRVGMRLTGSVALGAAAGLLLALDGLHVALSRTAMLDVFLVLWVVVAFACLVLDRERADRGGGRRWLWAAGGALGLALATKWSALWFVVAFGLLVASWDARRLHRAGRGARAAVPTVARLGAVFGAVPLTVYVVSWAGWFAAGPATAWGRDAAATESGLLRLVPQPLRALVAYHRQMLEFHAGLAVDHAYASDAWSWLLLARPVLFAWDRTAGCGGTGSDGCVSSVLALGNPAVWWGFLVSVPALLVLTLRRRDWRGAAVLVAAAAGVLPWLAFPERTAFQFYAAAALPFLVLATASVLRAGIPAARGPHRTLALVASSAYVGLAVGLAAFFLPVVTGMPISYDAWYARMWFDRWI